MEQGRTCVRVWVTVLGQRALPILDEPLNCHRIRLRQGTRVVRARLNEEHACSASRRRHLRTSIGRHLRQEAILQRRPLARERA